MSGRIVVALALVAAVFAGHSAFAFQEEKQGSAPAPAAEAAAPAEAATGDNAALGTETATKAETGTEIRIPGLGKLGVLPKMDFGLELLYGAAENAPTGQPDGVAPEDDLTVRGSVKHRF